MTTRLATLDRGMRLWASGSLSLCCILAGAQSAPDRLLQEPLVRGSVRPAGVLREAIDPGFDLREPPRFAIVELPRPGPPGQAPKRAQHALSIRSEPAEQWLRGIGISARECATHLRLPSRWRQDSANRDGGFEVQAQVRLVCRF